MKVIDLLQIPLEESISYSLVLNSFVAEYRQCDFHPNKDHGEQAMILRWLSKASLGITTPKSDSVVNTFMKNKRHIYEVSNMQHRDIIIPDFLQDSSCMKLNAHFLAILILSSEKEDLPGILKVVFLSKFSAFYFLDLLKVSTEFGKILVSVLVDLVHDSIELSRSLTWTLKSILLKYCEVTSIAKLVISRLFKYQFLPEICVDILTASFSHPLRYFNYLLFTISSNGLVLKDSIRSHWVFSSISQEYLIKIFSLISATFQSFVEVNQESLSYLSKGYRLFAVVLATLFQRSITGNNIMIVVKKCQASILSSITDKIEIVSSLNRFQIRLIRMHIGLLIVIHLFEQHALSNLEVYSLEKFELCSSSCLKNALSLLQRAILSMNSENNGNDLEGVDSLLLYLKLCVIFKEENLLCLYALRELGLYHLHADFYPVVTSSSGINGSLNWNWLESSFDSSCLIKDPRKILDDVSLML